MSPGITLVGLYADESQVREYMIALPRGERRARLSTTGLCSDKAAYRTNL